MRPGSDRRGTIAQFGMFEVDLSRGEVRKEGRRVPLQRHSFLVLATLVDRAGEDVSREDLRRLLWPNVEFLDFENGINSAVARLRQALGDSADNPRFVATRRGRGYRLILPVTWPGDAPIAASRPAMPEAAARTSARRAARRWLLVAAAVCAIAVFIAWLVTGSRSPSNRSSPFVASAATPYTVQAFPGGKLTGSFALSPDGRRLAFVVGGETPEQSRLWLRALDGVVERPLAGTDAASLPFWSPDGRSLGFFAHGRLKTIEIDSDRIASLAEAPRGRGGTWNAAGTILFAADIDTPILSVPASGGTVVAVTDRTGAASHRFPAFLADGSHFLYLVLRDDRDASEVWWGRLGGGETARLLTAASNALATKAGEILFVRGSTLFAQSFDLATLRALAPPVVVSEHVGIYGEEGPTGLAAFSVSADGVLATTEVPRPAERFSWFDRSGRPLPTAATAGDFIAFDLAPDEGRVAAARFDPRKRSSDILMIDLRSGLQTQVTDDPWPDAAVEWAPSGTRLAFTSLRDGTWTAIVRDTSRAAGERLVGAPCQSIDGWFPDGAHLLCQRTASPGAPGVGLWKVPVDGHDRALPLVEGASPVGQARVSPDGRWLAYASDAASADLQLNVVEIGAGASRPIALGAGLSPRWRRDGRELFFLAGRHLMSVAVTPSRPLRLGPAHRLFDATLPPHDSLADFGLQFDVSADGSRFLLAVPAASADRAPLSIVPRAAWHRAE